MFENLSERLERSFKLLKGEGKISELNVAETLKDVRRALLEADVNYNVVRLTSRGLLPLSLCRGFRVRVRPLSLASLHTC